MSFKRTLFVTIAGIPFVVLILNYDFPMHIDFLALIILGLFLQFIARLIIKDNKKPKRRKPKTPR